LTALYKTITIILDYIITTLQFAPIPNEFGLMPMDEAEMREPEHVTSVPRDLRGRGPWAVVVWGDDKHTAKEFTRQIRDAAGVSHRTAEAYTREIEETVSLRVVCHR
jgi:E3 ubiquitin-protein ligase UBR1